MRDGSERWLYSSESDARRSGKKKEEAGEMVERVSIESEGVSEEVYSLSN